MRYLVECNQYRIVADILPDTPDKSLPGLCRAAEMSRDDGIAVVACEGSRFIAASDGMLIIQR